ncbi:hypothetical protein ACVINW_001348 [Bradyrhizobium sp. USDA 4461]
MTDPDPEALGEALYVATIHSALVDKPHAPINDRL